MKKIKIARAGVGNCASTLIQGIYYYKDKNPKDAIGLMHWDISGYTLSDIGVVAAFDIDKRKVGNRTIELILDENGENTFKIYVNKKEIFIRGVNWIPTD